MAKIIGQFKLTNTGYFKNKEYGKQISNGIKSRRCMFHRKRGQKQNGNRFGRGHQTKQIGQIHHNLVLHHRRIRPRSFFGQLGGVICSPQTWPIVLHEQIKQIHGGNDIRRESHLMGPKGPFHFF